jgi:Rha family phage regulatory protein
MPSPGGLFLGEHVRHSRRAARLVRGDNRDAAAHFEKRHDNVLRDIEELRSSEPVLKIEGGWFRLVEYFDANGQARPSYDLTRDGYTLLVMGWTGERQKPKKTRAQSRMAAPWITDRARGGEMGGRLLLQRGGHRVVPAGRPAEAEREPRGLAEWTPRLSRVTRR